MVFQWAVRVGQRLQSRFGQSGAVRKLNCRQLEGVCQALERVNLFLAGVVAAFRGTIGMDCSSDGVL